MHGHEGKWGKNYLTTSLLLGDIAVGLYKRGTSARVIKEKCSGVIIATHPPDTTNLAIEALEAGLHVMMEKPAALSVADAERLVAAEKASGKVVLVNHQHLFAPAYEELYRQARTRVEVVHASGGGPGPVRAYSDLWDYGPHDVAMVADLIGTPEVTYAERRSSFWSINLVGKHGSATVHVSNRLTDKCRFLRAYEPDLRSSWIYDDCAPHKLLRNNQPVPISPELPLTRSLKAFTEAVRLGGTDDRRFGARWALTVANVLQRAEDFAALTFPA
jgi:hypothetical protein